MISYYDYAAYCTEGECRAGGTGEAFRAQALPGPYRASCHRLLRYARAVGTGLPRRHGNGPHRAPSGKTTQPVFRDGLPPDFLPEVPCLVQFRFPSLFTFMVSETVAKSPENSKR